MKALSVERKLKGRPDLAFIHGGYRDQPDYHLRMNEYLYQVRLSVMGAQVLDDINHIVDQRGDRIICDSLIMRQYVRDELTDEPAIVGDRSEHSIKLVQLNRLYVSPHSSDIPNVVLGIDDYCARDHIGDFFVNIAAFKHSYYPKYFISILKYPETYSLSYFTNMIYS